MTTPTPEPLAPVVTVDADGRVAHWHPALGFYGDEQVTASAREAAGGRYAVEWGRLPEPVIAGQGDAFEALHALMYHLPGRTRILAWPDEVREWWEDTAENCDGHGFTPEPDATDD